LSRAKGGCDVGEGVDDAVRGFVEDVRAGWKRFERGAALAFFRRQEAVEEEALC
jgi:hypothetical protein